MNAHRVFCILALAFVLAACGGGGSSDSASNPPPTSPTGGKTISQTIISQQAGQYYDLSIYLPVGYDTSTKSYPVIYLTDADYRFAPNLAVLQATGVDAILVGINNEGNSRRLIDFGMPTAERYYAFLTLELMPFIESQFRVDSSKRVLSGHSASGAFVAYAILLEQPDHRYFWAFDANDGSFNWQPSSLQSLEQQAYLRSHQLPTTLFLSGDTLSGNLGVVQAYCGQMESQGYSGLNIRIRSYSLGHLPMDPVAFGDALNFIFGLGKVEAGAPTDC